MARLKILISGAGIAGCTAAYWLTRNGHAVTVVERGGGLRATGSPVDVRGPAADVAARMNISEQIREARIGLAGMTLLDSAGRRVARVDIEGLRSSIAPKDIEIARGDLSTILYAAGADHTDYVFGDSIKSLVQDEAGVDVAFERSRPQRYDLVVGADGLHSKVRRLAFGPESDFVRHAGLYAATVALPESGHLGREMFLLNAPGRLAAFHPCHGAPVAYFVFWHPEIAAFDYTNLAQHKGILERTFGDIGWKVPEFLAVVRAANDMYFDSVARLEVPEWARGRVVLLGDASSCVSLFGDGATLAIAGAYRLATELQESPTDPWRAFQRYQATHYKLVASKQKNLMRTASRIVPRTSAGIWLSSRVFWKTMTGVATVAKLVQRVRRP